VSASDVTIRDNNIEDNDKVGPVFVPGATNGCPGQPAFETDETGDCGGGLHLIGTWNSVISGNLSTRNGDGILLSDETAATHDNLLIHNVVKDNALECGIVFASHPPVGSSGPYFAPHNGVYNNTVIANVSADNGVQVGGAGMGLFSDGAGPGRVGININSGGGGSPVLDTVIAQNVIRDEDVDIAVNTPATVNIHLNDLLGGKVGVANICAFDGASCAGGSNATENWWGCHAGPGGHGCTTVSGANVIFDPWLQQPATDNDDGGHNDQH
jgi:hypothetical protein